jgi:hypothetical protein
MNILSTRTAIKRLSERVTARDLLDRCIVTSELDIEELIKTSIDSHLLNYPIGISTPPPISLSRTDVEDIVNTSIGHLGLDKIIKSSIGVSDVERIVNTSIGLAIEPITQTIDELKAELEAMRGELKKFDAID